jgi:hypothetical protein
MRIGKLDTRTMFFLNLFYPGIALLNLDIEMFYELDSKVHVAEYRGFDPFNPAFFNDLVVKKRHPSRLG